MAEALVVARPSWYTRAALPWSHQFGAFCRTLLAPMSEGSRSSISLCASLASARTRIALSLFPKREALCSISPRLTLLPGASSCSAPLAPLLATRLFCSLRGRARRPSPCSPLLALRTPMAGAWPQLATPLSSPACFSTRRRNLPAAALGLRLCRADLRSSEAVEPAQLLTRHGPSHRIAVRSGGVVGIDREHGRATRDLGTPSPSVVPFVPVVDFLFTTTPSSPAVSRMSCSLWPALVVGIVDRQFCQ